MSTQNDLPGIGETPLEPNPMVRIYGRGEAQERCKDCQRLSGGRYLKCSLRPHTNGAATDHRAGWNACQKFIPA